MFKAIASTATASADTVKTQIGVALSLPASSKKILGMWAYALGGAGMTTLQNVTGIVEFESPDINLQPCQIPLDPVVVVGTAVSVPIIRVWPVNIDVHGLEKITAYVTLDLATTIHNLCRWGLLLEVGS